MNAFSVSALSPLDGRYAAKLTTLRGLMSEQGFMHRRVQVEITWLLALSDAGLPHFKPFSPEARRFLRDLVTRFGTDDALALSMINVIIDEELYDEEFVRKWTVGFDELQKRVPIRSERALLWGEGMYGRGHVATVEVHQERLAFEVSTSLLGTTCAILGWWQPRR